MPDLPFLAAAFAPTARTYCDFVAAFAELERAEFLAGALPLLARTYAEVSAWPPSREIDAPMLDPGARPPAVRDELDEFLGVTQHHGRIFDPFEPDPKVVEYSVAADLSDVRDDLLDGLRILDAGHPAAALWHWRFNFEVHWGYHATAALRAIHALGSHHTEFWFGPDD